jgi:glycosyltransferase involved in cell wall biosynthesis/spore maturation protein CgeB
MSDHAQYRILLLDTKHSNPNHYICRALLNALKSDPRVEAVHLATYADGIQKAAHCNCNLFIAFDGEELNRKICHRISQICGTSVVWLTDDPYELEVNRKNSEIFDLVCTNDAQSVTAYDGRAILLPLAAAPEYHSHPPLPPHSENFLYDVFFAGTAWPNRVAFLNKLISRLPDLRYKIALPHNQFLKPPSLPLPLSALMWRTPPEEFARFANRSRVVVNLFRSFSASSRINEAASTPPPRVFEIACAGTLQLIDSAFSETAEFFTPNSEIVVYEDVAHCAEVIQHYLRRPAERHAVALAAREKALSQHTYHHRVRTLLDAVEAAASHRPQRKSLKPPHRRRVLFVSHNIISVPPFGGVEVYQDRVSECLSKDYEIFFYFLDRRFPAPTYSLSDSQYRTLERFVFSDVVGAFTASDPMRERVFADILGRYEFDLVHFQHLIGSPPSLLRVARACGVATVLTLQDFWVLCDSFNLLDGNHLYCDIRNRSDEACDVCTRQRLDYSVGAQDTRRAIYHWALLAADAVIVNTSGYVSYLKRFFPDIAVSARIHALPLPLPNVPPAESGPRREGRGCDAADSEQAPSLKVAILGNFTYQKGADNMCRILNELRDEDIEFCVLGRVDPPYDKILQALSLEKLTIKGQYRFDELPVILQDFDISLHLSIWPETYCLTLSEAWKNGLVPIVTDLGATGERVQQGVNGFKVPVGDPGQVIHLLRMIQADRSVLKKISSSVGPHLYTDEAAHCSELRRVYESVLPAHSWAESEVDSSEVFSSPDLLELGVTFGVTEDPNSARRAILQSSLTSVDVLEIAPKRRGGVPPPPPTLIPGTRLRALQGGFENLPQVQGGIFFDSLAGSRKEHEWIGAGLLQEGAIALPQDDALQLAGWLVDLEGRRASSRASIVFLRPDTGRGRYATLSRFPRPDVCKEVGLKDESMPCGFSGRIELNTLEPSPHQIWFVQNFGTTLIRQQSALVVYPVSPFYEVLPRALRGKAEGGDALGHLDVVAGSPYELFRDRAVTIEAGGSPAVEIAGWAIRDVDSNACLPVWISLTSIDQGIKFWVEATRVPRPDVAGHLNMPVSVPLGFAASIFTSNLAEGEYEITAWLQDEAVLLKCPFSARLMVSSPNLSESAAL